MAIQYESKYGELRLFYPDFVIKRSDRIGIFDIKLGQIAESVTEKAEALYQYCQNNKGNSLIGILSKEVKGILKDGDLKLLGGIAVLSRNGLFKFHDGDSYEYYINNLDEWQDLKFK
ncbi:hypothetical protein [Abyssogena phaseoliformis symbiont]|uniref:hypothetical protein n=1 Tax=Abyssogena phaseoliformis symbiont TaxID=596095 RepID=UPI001914E35F|nr:hypothetical protein [Abyssogena phaseoliformis symbiont]